MENANDMVGMLPGPELHNADEDKQPTTLNATVPVQLSELDFMKFQLAREKYQRAQLTYDMCVREAQRAEGDLAHKGHLLGQLTRELAQKHEVDLDAMMVSDDGYFMPRPAQQLPTRR